MRLCRTLALAFVLFTATFTLTTNANAACVPGLPCLTPPTPQQLDDPSTGPNDGKEDYNTFCDANFMNQIYGKAFIEAERETVVNNSIFLKPDSVLEYTCIDQHIAAVAEDAGPLFSESDEWAPETIDIGGSLAPGGSLAGVPVPSITINVNMGDTYLDRSVERVAMESIKSYVDDNFEHDFLGGAASGDNNSISETVNGVGNVCDFMYTVYHIAKCDDFSLQAPYSATRFSNLVNNDLRNLPRACPDTHQITQTHLDLANNLNRQWVSFEDVEVLYEIIETPAGNCRPPIPTGVVVTTETFTQPPNGPPVSTGVVTFDEHVCPNPACYYDRNGNSCEK